VKKIFYYISIKSNPAEQLKLTKYHRNLTNNFDNCLAQQTTENKKKKKQKIKLHQRILIASVDPGATCTSLRKKKLDSTKKNKKRKNKK